MPEIKTSIIIVNYNTIEVLKTCIESVYKFENELNFEIMIIDNASKDKSPEEIEKLVKRYKNLKAIYLKEIKSFSYANNRGIEISKSEFILLMNPDIIFESEIIDKLINYMNNNKDAGAISPALIDINGEFQRRYYQKYPTIMQFIFFQSIVLRMFYKKPYFINKYYLDDQIDFNNKKEYDVNMIPGAFFFTTKKILDEVGFLDENFDLFFEDTDLSYRIKKRFKLIVDTNLYVKHLGGASFKDIQWWIYGRFNTSMIYFFKKHYRKSAYLSLRYLAICNAYWMLTLEYIFKIFGKRDNFRIKKYRNFLSLVKEV